MLKGAAYLDKLPRSDKQRAIKAYKEIYGGDCVLEIAEAFCEGDELYEELETRELGIGPIKAEVVEQALLDVLDDETISEKSRLDIDLVKELRKSKE